MSLSAIVTGSPLFKALTNVQDKPVSNKKDTVVEASAKAEAQAKDTVKLSPQAIALLKADITKGEDSARRVADDIREALVQSQTLSLSKNAQGLGTA